MFKFVFLSIFMCLIFFIFYINFTLYSLMYLFFLYILVFFLFLTLNLELIALFLLLVYVGGIMVLFLFLLLLLETNKSIYWFIRFNFGYLEFFYFVCFILIFFFFFWGFMLFFDPIVFKKELLNIDGNSLLLKYLILKCNLIGFDGSVFYKIALSLYTTYYLPLLLSFLIFLISLFGIISLLSNRYSHNSYCFIAVSKHRCYTGSISASSLLNEYFFTEIDVLFVLFYGFVFTLLFLFIFTFFIAKNFNFLRFLIFLEVLVLVICSILVFFSYFLADLDGCVFIIFIFGCYAAETVIGLSLFSVSNTIKTDFFKKKKSVSK